MQRYTNQAAFLDHFHYRVEIIGNPQPKPLPKFSAWIDNSGTLQRRVFNTASQEMRDFGVAVKQMLQVRGSLSEEQFPIWRNHHPVTLVMIFAMRPPNTMFEGRDRNRSLRGGSNTVRPYNQTPDVDNLVKFVNDALTGVAFEDDSQVCKVTTIKKWDTAAPYEGRTTIYMKGFTEADNVY